MKKIVDLALVFSLMLGIFALGEVNLSVSADTDKWQLNTYSASSALEPHYGSNGKFLAPIAPPDPDSIPISEEWELSDLIRGDLTGKYHLTCDIYLNDYGWSPIDNFSGTLDGQGYVIYNLDNSNSFDPDAFGLFYSIKSATIKNLGLEGTNINLDIDTTDGGFGNISVAGGIAAYIQGDSTIINCYNIGNVSVSHVSIWNNTVAAGGIFGYASNHGINVTISDCYNVGDISVSSSTAGSPSDNNLDARAFAYAGGIGGTLYSADMSSCYNQGNISAKAETSGTSSVTFGQNNVSAYAGGILGYAANSGNIYIEKSYNKGDVSVDSSSVQSSASSAAAGGILGRSTGDTSIENCYNTGDVSSVSDEGNTLYTTAAAGILGWGYMSGKECAISNCYNTGNISRSSKLSHSTQSYLGAIVGFSRGDDTITNNCYWNIDSVQKFNESELANSDKKGVGMISTDNTTSVTTADMKLQNSFEDWDFAEIWAIDPNVNDGYPFLLRVNSVLKDIFGSDAENYRIETGDNGNDYIIGDKSVSFSLLSGVTVLDKDGNPFADEKKPEKVGTGMIIMKDGEKVGVIVINKDLSGEGSIDIQDAQILLESLVGNTILTDAQTMAADGIVNNGAPAIKKLRQFLNALE